ncbi:MAG: hypothetical protein WCW25_01430 [Patescibacteria group bacterium]|jgi:hypothetical protein
MNFFENINAVSGYSAGNVNARLTGKKNGRTVKTGTKLKALAIFSPDSFKKEVKTSLI